jgi:hypothetical protein
MRTWIISSAGLFALALAFLCAPTRAESGRMLVIVHPKVPVGSLTHDELESIFTLSRQRWPNGDSIVVFNFGPGTSERTRFDQLVLGMDPDAAAHFWIDRRIRDGGAPPRKVPSAQMMQRVIASLPGSIGYLPETELGPDVKVVTRIINGQVVPEKTGAPK